MTIGLVRSGALVATRRVATDGRATSDALEAALVTLLALDAATFARHRCHRLRLGRARSLTGHLETLADRRDLPLVIAAAGTVPIAVRVDRPSEVGADRLVNALAAARLYGTPAVVVDFGTATTLDCVAADGAYVGGAIAPGLELGLEALATRTARLPRVELRMPDRVIGRDTVSAIQAGAVVGACRARRRRCSPAPAGSWPRSTGVEPREVKAILTGGLSAAPWATAIADVDAIDPELTLKGLAILHAEVTGGERLELGLP